MLDGEIDYSIFARIWDIRQYRSKTVFMQELFGNKSAVASIGLSNHISYFIDNLAPGHGYTFDSFVDKHTLFPWITSFQSHKRVLNLRSDVRSQKKHSIGVLAGLVSNSIPLALGLRLCPNCVDIDRDQHGFCYWHREHQIFGIDVCYIHGIPLQTFEEPVRKQSDRRLCLSAENALQMMELENNVSPVCFEDTRWKLARDAHWILCQHDLPSRLTSTYDRYQSILESLSLLTSTGLTRLQRIADLFQKSHPHELITLLRCKMVNPLNASWLTRILSGEGTQHPIRHLMLLYALEESAETFFDQSRVYKPFGLGPWPCLNPVCPQYKKHIIRNRCITNNRRLQSISVFNCELCGFSYALKQNHGNDNISKYDYIKKYGSLWEEKLCETWNDTTMSIRRIARHLGVSVTAILRSAIRLDLAFPKPGSKHNKPKHLERKPKIDIHRGEYRRLWLEAQNKSPYASRTKIKKLLPHNVYVWLLKNDKDWLNENSPRTLIIPCKGQRKTNTTEQDSDLARLILEIVSQIKNHPGIPIRITITEIRRRIDKPSVLQRRLDIFPETQAVIQEVVESIEEYAIRKMNYIALQAKRSNITLTRYYLLRKSSAGRFSGNEFIEQAIQNILEEYNSIQPGLSIE